MAAGRKTGPVRTDGMVAVDAHIGRRMRRRRVLLGLSQSDPGARVGVTFQQVQKYEKGANRVSASRLADIARVLGVTPAWFFEGLGADGAPEADGVPDEGAQGSPEVGREALELGRAFERITDPERQRLLLGLVAAIVDAQRR